MLTAPAIDNRTRGVYGKNEDVTPNDASLFRLIKKLAAFCEIQRFISDFSTIQYSTLL